MKLVWVALLGFSLILAGCVQAPVAKAPLADTTAPPSTTTSTTTSTSSSTSKTSTSSSSSTTQAVTTSTTKASSTVATIQTFTATQNGPSPLDIVFDVKASGSGALGYSLDFGDGTYASGSLPAEPIVHSYLNRGDYSVELRVESATKSMSLHVGRADPWPVGNFCGSGCQFSDDQFHQYTLYDVDTPNIDIIIVPPASPFVLSQTKPMVDAVKAWRDGIQLLGQDWAREGIKFNIYLAGTDTIPPEALQDPEIVVLGAEVNPVVLFGIGLAQPVSMCLERGGFTRTYETHEHDGMRIVAGECKKGGFTCYAINTNFLFGGAVYMQDLVAHEVGHCLGTGHVGDALDFSAKTVPLDDIMSYQHTVKPHCVSNMNVRSLEDVYATLLDRPEADKLRAGQYLAFNPEHYEQVSCNA